MSTTYSGRIFTVGDTIKFSKFGITIGGGYSGVSGTKGTCSGKITSLYEATYAFPIVISGTVTAGTGGAFTGCTVKPADVISGYQVKVTYNHNGGAGTASQTGYVGKSLTGTSSRTGYTFAGWYTAASGGSKVTTIPANATTLYAHWTANKYTVTLNNQSATTAGSTSVSATYGSAMPSITKPSKTGYTFGGYYTSTGGSGTQYYTAAGASARSWNVASATTLYAKWTANSYTVHFDGNGATSGSMNDQSFTYNTSQALSSNGFSRGAAYVFAGWNTKADGSGTAVAANYSASKLSATNGSTVTLYAQWELQYLSPSISNVRALRYANGTEDDEGTCVHVEFDWEVDTIVSSTNYATSVKIQYREQGTSTWQTLNEDTYNSQTQQSVGGHVSYTSPANAASTDKTYDILISITDRYGSDIYIDAPHAVAVTFLSLAFFTMDFASGGKGVGIGSPAPTEGLRIGMDTEVAGDFAGGGEVEDGFGNKLSDMPTKTSDLTNDSGYLTSGDILPLFKKVSVTKTVSSIGANSSKNQSFAPDSADVPSGYTRVGIIGWNTANIHVFIATCTGTTVTLANASSSSQTCTNAQVDWLYIRSSI